MSSKVLKYLKSDAMFDTLRSIMPTFIEKESRQGSVEIGGLQFYPDNTIVQPTKYKEFAAKYKDVLWVYACVWALGSHGSSLPFKIFEESADGSEKTEVSKDKECWEIFKRPNDRDTFSDLVEGLITYLELNGDGYWEIVKDKNGIPRELYNIKPDRIFITPKSDGKGIKNYKFKLEQWKSKSITFSPNEVVHFYYFNPLNVYYGQGTLMAAISTIMKEEYADLYHQNLMKNDGVPRGFLATDWDVDDSVAKRIRQKWKQYYAGPRKAGEIAILPLGLQFKELANTPRDMEYTKLCKDNRERLFSIFGVNNSIFGITENMTYDNYRTQLKAFFVNTMRPKMTRISKRITRDILSYWGDNLVFEFDFTGVLKEEDKEVSNRHQKEISCGMLNPNESRREMGREPYDGGDTFYIASNLQPVGSEEGEEMPQVPDEKKPETEEKKPEEKIKEPLKDDSDEEERTVKKKDVRIKKGRVRKKVSKNLGRKVSMDIGEI